MLVHANWQWVLAREFGDSFPEIGMAFGGRDH